MKAAVLLAASACTSLAAIGNFRVLGTTATQALIAYNAPDGNACTIQVSQSASLAPLALDVDPATFANSNSDLSRPNTVTSGLSRTVPIGQRTAQYATAGTYAGVRHFSRALQTYTSYFGKVTCPSTGDAVSFTFTTGNIPLGQTYGDPWLADPAHPGDQPWPESLGTNTVESFVDPITGTFEYRVGLRGNTPSIWNLVFGTAYNQGHTPCDTGDAWATPCGLFSSSSTTVSNSNAPLVLRPLMSNNPPWDTTYASGWSLDQLGLSLTGSVSTGTDVENVCISLNAGASCASSVQQLTLAAASSTQTVGVAPPSIWATPQFGTTSWELDTSPRLNAQETSTHSGTATVSGSNVTWASGDPFSLYWITGGNGRIRLSSNNDACTSPTPPSTTTAVEYTIAGFVNGLELTVSGSPAGGTMYWCADNFALMVWRNSPDTRTVAITGAVLNAMGSYSPSFPDNGTGTACFNKQIYGGWFCLFGGMYWVNPSGPDVVYYGEPEAAGQYPVGTNISNSWKDTSPAQGNSASIDQTQSNFTFYMVGMDPAGAGPLVIQGVFTPGATPQQYSTPMSGNGIAQIGNALPASATDYSVTWNASAPSPWSMTWTNLTPQSTMSESIVQQMAAFDPTFNPSYYEHTYAGGWNCQLSGIMTTGVFFFSCYTLGGDSPAWIFAFQPGDGNPAHAGMAGGPNVIGAINTFNTPNGPVASGQGALVGRTLHAITESGETGWVGITANAYSIYTAITKSTLSSIPAAGPAKCNTYVSSLSATADCIAVQMLANTGSYEPYLVGAPNPPFTGAPGELRTLKLGDAACITNSSSSCAYSGSAGSELMTLVAKNLDGVAGYDLLQRDSYGVETSISSGPLYFWWQSYQSGLPYASTVATNEIDALQLWWNPLAGCNGSPDPHGDCLLQDTNLGYGHGEWRGGGESLGVNVPEWKVPGADMYEIAWPGDYQTIVGSVPGIFSLPLANMTPYQTPGINYVSLSPPFATAYGVPFQPDAGQHPNPAGAVASAYEQLQAFDDLPLQGGAYDPPFTLVSGQLYQYVPGTVTDPDDFVTSGSVAYINRKLMATGAACGSHPLIDVSGPGSSISTGTGSSYTYCVARGSGECYSGSAAGNVYVNCPGVTYSFCNGAATHGGTPLGVGNDICVGNLAKVANGITQYTLNHTDYADAYTRVLAAATSRLRMVTGFETDRLLPDNSWLLYPQEFLNYQRPSEMWMLQQPPYPAADSINRGTFVPVTVTLTPPAGIGANNAIVEFGYQEYGAPQLINCTTRNDACIATASTVTQGNQPFYFASENPAGAACAAGCTITIPAISQRILYYRVEYRAANNSVLAAGPLTSVVVP
jgi:hypothetical protein